MISSFLIFLAIIVAGGVLLWQGIHSPQSQLFGRVIWRGSYRNPKIALTFDDGPNPLATPLILKILEEANIKATFFIIGLNAKKHPSILKEMAKRGHEIEVHSWRHHPLFFLSSPKKQSREILETKKIIENIAGRTPQFFRPPWGNRSPWLLTQVKKSQLETVTWSVDPWDAWLKPVPQSIMAKTKKQIHNGAIILLHDGCGTKVCQRKATIKALPILISMLKKQEFSFITLDELLSR